jgi:tight adherence protein B
VRQLKLVLAGAALVTLTLTATASAGVRLNGLDFGAYPTFRATVVTSTPTSRPPTLLENGKRIDRAHWVNLSRSKNVVLALDNSRSMAGKPLVEAVTAAAAFVRAKPTSDRIALATFGKSAVQQSRFSTATIDADSALRSVAVSDESGTALWDAIDLSARALAGSEGGKVIILLTDGDDVGSKTSQAAAVRAVHEAGAVVYPIAFGSHADTDAMKKLASETGGTFHSASDPAALKKIYAAIARELRRTWRVDYLTTARPGDEVSFKATAGSLGYDDAQLKVPDSFGGVSTKPSPLLPGPIYGKAGDLLFTLIVGLLVLAAAIIFTSSLRGSWLKQRLAPHVNSARGSAKKRTGRERLEMFNGLFRVTENTFGHRKQWRSLQLLLDRADLPLRTVEFAWLLVGCSFFAGLAAAVTGRGSLVILGMFAFGAAIPYSVVWFKARRRLTAFEDQLPDLLITMAASLKAGHSFKQGVQSVVDEGQEPAAKEFRRVLTETQLGRPMEEALQETADRIGSKNFSFVITAVNIQRQVGGSLAGLFDMVADTVRQRQQFARKIRSLTAMGRASAYVLLGLPFFVALAITVLNPTYMDPLYHSHKGHVLIMVGLVMMAFGSLVLKKIVSFKG